MIPHPFLDELLARADIVEIIGRFVELKRSGANYKACCPFHEEKTPSFMVSPARQTYHCFGCGEHGNVLGFLMKHSGAEFPAAVQDLAQLYGLKVPEEHLSAEQQQTREAEREKKLTLAVALEKAAKFYAEQLPLHEVPQQYLLSRTINAEMVQTFALGYAPNSARPLTRIFSDYGSAILQEAGLVRAQEGGEGQAPSHRDWFRHRLMFPIRNARGEVIAFGARSLDGAEPKYLNSPESALFHKGSELYGLFENRKTIQKENQALVVEGYIDVIMLAQAGLGLGVAALGTALSEAHLRTLVRLTDRIIFSFDGDEAGRKAAARALVTALPFAEDQRELRFLFLPSEHDPDSYVRAHGAEAFRLLLAKAQPLSQVWLQSVRTGCDLQMPEGRSRLLMQALPLWQPLPEGALKRQLLGEVAALSALGVKEVWQLWNQSATRRSRMSTAPIGSTPAPPAARWQNAPAAARAPLRAAPLSRADRIARLLLLHPAWMAQLSEEDFALLAEQSEPLRALFAWLESQWAEHGARAWALLQPALQNAALSQENLRAAAERAQQLMSDQALDMQADLEHEPEELRDLLDQTAIESLKARENELLSDPSCAAEYRQTQQQRKAREQAWRQRREMH